MNHFSIRSIVAQLFLTLSILIIVWMMNIPLALAGATLENVRSMGVVRCGVTEELTSFSFKNKTGCWAGDLVGTPVAGIAGAVAVRAAGAEVAGVVPVILEVEVSVASVVFVETVASVVKERILTS